LNVKKRLVYGGIAFIWIFEPIYMICMTSLSTDIVGGSCVPWGATVGASRYTGSICVPWGAYSSYATEKAITFLLFLMTYLVPLMLMVFCYSRVVYSMKRKVVLTGT